MENNCRVCGFYLNNPPWGNDGESPSYEICPCCGVEFGNEDYTIESIKKYRNKWLTEGAKWFSPEKKPVNWNKESQYNDIPTKYR